MAARISELSLVISLPYPGAIRALQRWRPLQSWRPLQRWRPVALLICCGTDRHMAATQLQNRSPAANSSPCSQHGHAVAGRSGPQHWKSTGAVTRVPDSLSWSSAAAEARSHTLEPYRTWGGRVLEARGETERTRPPKKGRWKREPHNQESVINRSYAI